MSRVVDLLLAVAFFFIAGICMLVFSLKLRRYRIDISAHDGIGAGRSRNWFHNVENPDNYNQKGQKLLRYYWLITTVQIITMLNIMRAFLRAA